LDGRRCYLHSADPRYCPMAALTAQPVRVVAAHIDDLAGSTQASRAAHSRRSRAASATPLLAESGV
jgi:hypothetical protein